MAIEGVPRYSPQTGFVPASSPNGITIVKDRYSKCLSIRTTARLATLFVAAILLDVSALRADKASDAATQVKAAATARTVTIYRDSYGVPHVYGPTDAA